MKRKALLPTILTLTLFALMGMAPSAPQQEKDANDPQAAAFVLKFYRSYVGNLLAEKDDANEPLKRQYMTPALVTELARMLDEEWYDADPIIRAQDFSDGMLQSLRVEHVVADWYVVSYRFSAGAAATRIPVRVVKSGEAYWINCIPPEV
jgi:hypothetical protein